MCSLLFSSLVLLLSLTVSNTEEFTAESSVTWSEISAEEATSFYTVIFSSSSTDNVSIIDDIIRTTGGSIHSTVSSISESDGNGGQSVLNWEGNYTDETWGSTETTASSNDFNDSITSMIFTVQLAVSSQGGWKRSVRDIVLIVVLTVVLGSAVVVSLALCARHRVRKSYHQSFNLSIIDAYSLAQIRVDEYQVPNMPSNRVGDYETPQNSNTGVDLSSFNSSGRSNVQTRDVLPVNAVRQEAHDSGHEAHGSGHEAHGSGHEAHGSGQAAYGSEQEAHGSVMEAYGSGHEAHGSGQAAYGFEQEAHGSGQAAYGFAQEAHGSGQAAYGFEQEAHGSGQGEKAHGSGAEAHDSGEEVHGSEHSGSSTTSSSIQTGGSNRSTLEMRGRLPTPVGTRRADASDSSDSGGEIGRACKPSDLPEQASHSQNTVYEQSSSFTGPDNIASGQALSTSANSTSLFIPEACEDDVKLISVNNRPGHVDNRTTVFKQNNQQSQSSAMCPSHIVVDVSHGVDNPGGVSLSDEEDGFGYQPPAYRHPTPAYTHLQINSAQQSLAHQQPLAAPSQQPLMFSQTQPHSQRQSQPESSSGYHHPIPRMPVAYPKPHLHRKALSEHAPLFPAPAPPPAYQQPLPFSIQAPAAHRQPPTQHASSSQCALPKLRLTLPTATTPAPLAHSSPRPQSFQRDDFWSEVSLSDDQQSSRESTTQ